jgi:hypothetical protein
VFSGINQIFAFESTDNPLFQNTKTSQESSFISHKINFIVVVFPAPFFPRNP